MGARDFTREQLAPVVDVNRAYGDFEQGVAVPVEAACLHVDDYGQETAEARS
jgi:hypothetical protein